jgi:micrococcal nuclease
MYCQTQCSHVFTVHKVDKIVDGDTVDVLLNLGLDVFTRKRIRLKGIDTPESRTRDLEEKRFGLLAKCQLKTWCKNKTIEIRCDPDKITGKFGRVLGEVWVKKEGSWINVNKWLCDNFFAVPYNGEKKNFVKKAHLDNRKKVLRKKTPL